jgi:hypothetical protein
MALGITMPLMLEAPLLAGEVAGALDVAGAAAELDDEPELELAAGPEEAAELQAPIAIATSSARVLDTSQLGVRIRPSLGQIVREWKTMLEG